MAEEEDDDAADGDGDMGMSSDQMFKTVMMRFMQNLEEKSEKTKRKRGIVGLTEDEDDEEDETASGSTSGFLGLKGAKGTVNVGKLKNSMGKEPLAFCRRMETLMAKAVDEGGGPRRISDQKVRKEHAPRHSTSARFLHSRSDRDPGTGAKHAETCS